MRATFGSVWGKHAVVECLLPSQRVVSQSAYSTLLFYVVCAQLESAV